MKKATIFKTGGIRPTNELLESWIGAVKWRKRNEELPKDKDGNDMEPWATLFFEGIETVPECMNRI